MTPLSEVIAELNNRFGLGLGTSDQILVYQQVVGLIEDTSMQQIALMNDEARFGQVADDRLDDIAAENAERNTEFMKLYFDNDEFQKAIKEAARKRTYRIITEPARDEALARLRAEMAREIGGCHAVSEPGGEVIVYRSPDGQSLVQLRAVAGTVWLAQAQIAALYDTSVPNIAQLIRRILEDGEVSTATINSELRVQTEGTRRVRREVKIYNLDMVLAVGYRVTTPRAVQFRQWATTVLREYLVKGFVLDDPRLKDSAGTDYFDELLHRIRDIRASEKRFYQKVRDLFAATSADYDGTSDTAKTFFATIQNKLIFAVTGSTAAELVMRRSDAHFPSMGLTTWTGDRIRKSDVVIAKNYLTEPEITGLNRLTTMFLDFAEDRAERHQMTLMTEWVAQTDRFLAFNEKCLLTGSGSVSASKIKAVAAERYAEFDERRKAVEAERAEADELEDLRTLTVIENRRANPERDEDGHLP